MKEVRKVAGILLILVMIFSLTACGGGGSSQKGSTTTITVFNWGDYIDESVLRDFEEEYGIKVNYDFFATNEVYAVEIRRYRL